MTNRRGVDRSRSGEAPGPVLGRFAAQQRYAVPDIPESTVPGYGEGFSPELRVGSEGTTPDDIRVGRREPPLHSPTPLHYLRRGSDELRRTSDEYTLATGWAIRQSKPNISPIPEQIQDIRPRRPTAVLGPNTYVNRVPKHIPRNVADAIGPGAVRHISMADHRRDYPIYGMRPQGGVGRNTYRLDPRPWDEDLYNPPQQTDFPSRAFGGNKTHRLA
jgi:hypothetical protein